MRVALAALAVACIALTVPVIESGMVGCERLPDLPAFGAVPAEPGETVCWVGSTRVR